jgi:S-DNA-T family DNA segregation ATPase FtsK/SpoIIIE
MHILIGYLLLAFSVLLGFASASFRAADSSWLVVTLPRMAAVAPSVAAPIASPFVTLYGRWGALLLAFGILVTGINVLTRKKIGTVLVKFSLFLISAICLSVILTASGNAPDFIDSGITGSAISRTMGEIAPGWVIASIFSVILFFALISSMKLFQSIAKFFGKGLGFFLLAPFELFGLVTRRSTASPETPERRVEQIFDSGDPSGSEADETVESHGTWDASVREPEAPDFLKRPLHSSPTMGASTTPKPLPDDGDAVPPDWLQSDDGRYNVIREIQRRVRNDSGEDPVNRVEFIGPGVHPETLTNTEPACEEIPGLPLTESLPFTEPPDAPSRNTGEAEKKSVPLILETASVVKIDPGIAAIPEEKPPLDPLPADAADDLMGLDIEEEETGDEEITGEPDYVAESKTRNAIPEDDDGTPVLFDETEQPVAYHFPDVSRLEKSFDNFSRNDESEEIARVSRIIETTFESFRISMKVSGHSRGPAITRYELIPPVGLKLKNIINLSDDLALNLGTKNIRIVAPIGNRSVIGVEVPNRNRRMVSLRDILESDEFKKNRAKLPLILGKDIAGNIVVEDLADMPHLLVAGTTGSGKSVYINALIGGLVYTRTAEELKFIFIDPKMVELELYNAIPHLLAPVITSPEEAIGVLEWTSAEMDRRYKTLSEAGVRNIVDYNREMKKLKRRREGFEPFPYIVVVIDEFANLMLRLPKETERVISRIAAMARAVGIHLVVATQRPSVDVVTGIIKANFPSRIAFRVGSQTDARTIMDKAGAEKLLGKGDMLFLTPNLTDILRIQSPYASNGDVEATVADLKRNGTADYVIDLEDLYTPGSKTDSDEGGAFDTKNDPVFADALRGAAEKGEVSASWVQRQFRVGYNRASRIVETMDRMKILGPSKGAGKSRDVLVSPNQAEEMLG